MQKIAHFANQHHLTYYQEAFSLALPSLNNDSQFTVKINNDHHDVAANEVLLTQFEAKNYLCSEGVGLVFVINASALKKRAWCAI